MHKSAAIFLSRMRSAFIASLFLFACAFALQAHAVCEVACVDLHSTANAYDLPVINVFDPGTHANERITDYSFRELVALTADAGFQRKNNMPKVCQSIYLMFGSAGPYCDEPLATLPALVRPVTIKAYVPPPPQPVFIEYAGPQVLLTDPVFPPWSPTYQGSLYHPLAKPGSNYYVLYGQ